MRSLADLEIKDLRLLEAIGETGSLEGAARRLHVSASAVSHHVARLQERFELQIVEREGRALRLTPEAALLLPLLHDWRDALGRVQEKLTSASSPRRLRIATQCYTAFHWLPGVIQTLRNEKGRGGRLPRRDEVPEFSIDVEASRKGWAPLLAGEVDLLLGWYDSAPPEVMSRKLFDDRFCVVCPPGHRPSGPGAPTP